MCTDRNWFTVQKFEITNQLEVYLRCGCDAVQFAGYLISSEYGAVRVGVHRVQNDLSIHNSH